MGIYLPNMETPKSCYNHCLEDFIANKEIGCPLKDYIESHQYKDRIHPDCPLIEIVPCGECKHYAFGSCSKLQLVVSPENFCSDGERK